MTARTVTVVAPGPLATIQDLGRPGLGRLGIGMSGAADVTALRRANWLVGNGPGAAGVEMTFGGLRLRFVDDAVVALTGAPCPASIDGREIAFGRPLQVPAGAELRCRSPKHGVRSYLAFDGGIEVPPVLGSRSTDTLSGLGPARLSAGVILPLGRPTTAPLRPPRSPLGVPAVEDSAVENFAVVSMLTLLPGPRLDWFTAKAVDLLFTSPWSVTPQADRVGVRLAGPPLARIDRHELPSEPMVAGALQVPPDGQPVLFLADHPVTGGYPVIGVVPDADLRHAAQLRPGKTVSFSRAPGEQWHHPW